VDKENDTKMINTDPVKPAANEQNSKEIEPV